jgi:hypothetical protein
MSEHAPASPGTAAASGRAKVFVSYSRKDLPFAQTLVEALGARGFDAFLDKTDIAPGEPWKERLAGLIAAADTVVFAISPDSITSNVCAWELEETARLGKRLIPVVARSIPDADAPHTLSRPLLHRDVGQSPDEQRWKVKSFMFQTLCPIPNILISKARN